METRAFEEIGLIPRSIIRTLDRFRKQLLTNKNKEDDTSVIQEFRVSRNHVRVSIKSLVILIIGPLIVHFLTINLVLMPLTKYLWNTQQNEIFLNVYQENRAFSELHDFEEQLFFESLIETVSVSPIPETRQQKKMEKRVERFAESNYSENNKVSTNKTFGESGLYKAELSKRLENSVSQKFQQKTIELHIYYNQQSIEAITNLFGDLITFFTIWFLFIWLGPQIIILKSFLTESLYSFNDTTKSFILILLSDLVVGFHSPHGWEILIEILVQRFGLPENQEFIFFFVGTFPVLLDTVFKYWVFRYLNQISPSTVVTYHNMIE